MAKKGRPTKTDSVLRGMRRQPEPKTPIATNMFLPNHSGIADHPEATSNFLKLDCSNDPLTRTLDIVTETDETLLTGNQNVFSSTANLVDLKNFGNSRFVISRDGNLILGPNQSVIIAADDAVQANTTHSIRGQGLSTDNLIINAVNNLYFQFDYGGNIHHGVDNTLNFYGTGDDHAIQSTGTNMFFKQVNADNSFIFRDSSNVDKFSIYTGGNLVHAKNGAYFKCTSVGTSQRFLSFITSVSAKEYYWREDQVGAGNDMEFYGPAGSYARYIDTTRDVINFGNHNFGAAQGNAIEAGYSASFMTDNTSGFFGDGNGNVRIQSRGNSARDIWFGLHDGSSIKTMFTMDNKNFRVTQDNGQITWGAGNDCYVQWNGANMVLGNNSGTKIVFYDDNANTTMMSIDGATSTLDLPRDNSIIKMGTDGDVVITTDGTDMYFRTETGSNSFFFRDESTTTDVLDIDTSNFTLNMRNDTSSINIGAGADFVLAANDGTNGLISCPNGYLDMATDMVFTGSVNGLPFGSCYGNEIGWSQANAVQNTWYDISDADMATGQLNLVTHDGNGQLTVTHAGMYAVDVSGAFEADATNVHVQIAVSINGTEAGAFNHFETFGTNRQQSMGITDIIDLAASDTVNVSIRTTDAGTPTLSIDHLMLRLIQIGGT